MAKTRAEEAEGKAGGAFKKGPSKKLGSLLGSAVAKAIDEEERSAQERRSAKGKKRLPERAGGVRRALELGEAVKELLGKGADPNGLAPLWEGAGMELTLLTSACLAGSRSAMDALLAAGADPNSGTRDCAGGRITPLWALGRSAGTADEDAIALMEAGADPVAPCSAASMFCDAADIAKGYAKGENEPAANWFFFHGRERLAWAAMDKASDDGILVLLSRIASAVGWSQASSEVWTRHPRCGCPAISAKVGELLSGGAMEWGEESRLWAEIQKMSIGGAAAAAPRASGRSRL